MSKRWSVNFIRPRLERAWGGFDLVGLSADWYMANNMTGHYVSVQVTLLGFALTLTRWLEPDVYGDGGVA